MSEPSSSTSKAAASSTTSNSRSLPHLLRRIRHVHVYGNNPRVLGADNSMSNHPVTWDDVRERILSHPEELMHSYRVRTTTGSAARRLKETAFCAMCNESTFIQLIPFDIIELAVRKCPEAFTFAAVVASNSSSTCSSSNHRDDNEYYFPTPLHAAICSDYRRNDVILFLLESHPEAARIALSKIHRSPDVLGRLRSLNQDHLVVKYMRITSMGESMADVRERKYCITHAAIIKRLLDAHPLDPRISLIIFKRFCNEWNSQCDSYRRGIFPVIVLFSRQLIGIGSDNLCENDDVSSTMQYTCCHGVDLEESMLLHSIFSTRFLFEALLDVISLIKFTIRHYQRYLMVRNGDGETLLFVWIKRNMMRYMISFLLKAEPRALGVPNNNGRLPLYYALAFGDRAVRQCLPSFIKAAPKACCTRDVETRMYPFMEAAAAANEKYRDLSTVFVLLKENPKAARGLLGTVT
mmetsp:Transcript_29146/g.45298  ORF Transcript_29146/g.45298 Transcript_29146/m.45298 type:complete len:465 (-) Transcript_29146:427-1821(-)|eukprot:CAMPEP_0196801444 /NCGR_PEP_ID=MMETSP1362-20130617/1198_1 /TAXON_ID=163516 /ORGANISM="Leptocylindrus danicus, Strain CCMP1856" /LENGTH=464 /DNA_ID=CAMNT_0042172413 /DNA_START=139 /DNA_END=1533 /DNA_ORIENTATION=-